MARVHALRRALRVLTIAGVWSLQLGFVVAAYDNPQKHFGYQPFSESSTWEATIVRVLRDGRRVDVRDGWSYEWGAMVRGRGLDRPWHEHHAASGVDATLERLQAALDWVATHTPEDTETRYLEAEVRTVRNRRPMRFHVLRSVER